LGHKFVQNTARVNVIQELRRSYGESYGESHEWTLYPSYT